MSTARGSDLEIELASKFAADEEFTAHHRMRLSLEDALGAREAKSDWQLRRFDFLDGIFWRVAPHRDNTQAFEEKFDVFSMRSAATAESGSATRSQEVAALGRSDLYRSRRHEYTGAWYVRDGSHAGCAAFKSFGPEGGADSFTFELWARAAIGLRNALTSQLRALLCRVHFDTPYATHTHALYVRSRRLTRGRRSAG